MLLVNANVMTMDPSRPRAEAVALEGGLIAAVGTNAQARAAHRTGEVLDLKGRTVIPGFNDAHCHPLFAGRALLDVDLSPASARNLADIQRLISDRARETPPGKWVVGHDYDVSKLAEGRHPTRQDLDQAAPRHPVMLHHVCTHVAVVNSLGLERMGYTRSSADPVGGRLGRDPATGDLTGRLDETAMSAARGAAGGPPRKTPQQDRHAVKRVAEKALALGLTSLTDAHVDPQGYRVLAAMAAEGALPLRVRVMVAAEGLEEVLAPETEKGDGSRLPVGPEGARRRGGAHKRLPTPFSGGDAWFRLIGGKLFADGAIAGRTACLTEPYEGTDDRGVLAIEPERLREQVDAIHRRGLQAGIHANGDRAIALALEAIEAAITASPRPDPRHRLEHGTVMTPDLIAWTKRLGVVVLPFGPYVWHHSEKMPSYGRRIEMMFAHRSLLDAGVPVGGSSDHPCAPLDPLLGVQSCVLRQGPGGEPLGLAQRITVEEALRVYTAGSAYASFDEAEKGVIRAGMLADLTVLGEDPTAVAPTAIKDVPVEMTIVAGGVAYCR